MFDLKQKIKLDVLMPQSMHLHTTIYPNLKSISDLFKMYMKSLDSFILASRIAAAGLAVGWFWGVFLHHVLK